MQPRYRPPDDPAPRGSVKVDNPMARDRSSAKFLRVRIRKMVFHCMGENVGKSLFFQILRGELAERVGFEPTVPCGTPDFESGTFGHSAISPASSRAHCISRLSALRCCAFA
jgi:hypothetical protein